MLNVNLYDIFAFDFDGTLVDSHAAYQQKDKLYVQHFYNKEVPKDFLEHQEQHYRMLLSQPYPIEYYMHLDKLFGDGCLPAEEIKKRLLWVDEHLVKPQIKIKTGALEALNIIKSKFPHKKFLLVTGSKKREIDYFSYNPLLNLSTLLNINNFFDCIITQDDVLEQKPSPEPYKKALELINAPRDSSVLVFEDSIEGIMSAKTNNATVVALENKFIYEDETLVKKISDYFFRDWESIIQILRR